MKNLVVARVVALLTLLLGLAGAPAAIAGRPWEGDVGIRGLGWSWRLDVVGVVLLVFMGFLGWVVVRFCAVNLRGRTGGRAVSALLTTTFLSLAVMVLSADLAGFALGWTLSGLAVTGLIARSGTERARVSAVWILRHLVVGDLALWLAVTLVWSWWGVTDRQDLGIAADQPVVEVTVIAAALVVACVARSGLVPAHRWLAETAEAPSPVSGLLHAGIVNGAGVLGVVTWPVLSASRPALAVLLVVGLVTVVVGAWSAVVRRDVKGRLASSTTTQMGFMTVQLGLGLPTMALMHLIAHGCYKSWLFLRAGGAVERHSHRWRTERRPVRGVVLTLLAAATAAGLGAPAALWLFETAGLVALVPFGLAVGAASLGGRAAAGLTRVGPSVATTTALVTGVAGGAYLWLLLGWEHLVAPALSVGIVWTPVAAAVVLLACAAAAVAVAVGCRVLVRRPTGRLGLLLFPLSVAPGRERTAAIDLPAVGTVEPDPTRSEAVARATERAVADVAPAWPLRAMVAANPLAPAERRPFSEGVLEAEDRLGARLRPSLHYFLARYDEGRITDADLAEAMHPSTGRPVEGSVEEVVRATRELVAVPAAPTSTPDAAAWRVREQVSVWCQLAWSSAADPASGLASGPYTLFRAAAGRHGFDRAVGVDGAAAWVRGLPEDPMAALDAVTHDLATDDAALERLLARTILVAPGWAGHAAWRARQTGSSAPLHQLLALSLALDLLLRGPDAVASTATADRATTEDRAPEAELSDLWQRALEVGPRRRLVGAVEQAGASGATRRAARPSSQSIWCIDVRSERIRRHLEAVGDHETVGFAGFFGIDLHHTDADGNAADLAPALVRPGTASSETERPIRLRQALHRTVTSVSRHPVAALAVADGGGFLSGLTSLAATVAPAPVRSLVRSGATDDGALSRDATVVTALDLEGRVALARAALVSTGLGDDLAPVLLVCGHGATVENNAFATAYACGACGGHAGAVNARVLAEVLNDPEVRTVLAERGLRVPDDTVAVPALHDTTTDTVTVLGDVPADLERDLRVAGERAAHERLRILPPRRRREDVADLRQRAADWSEPTPEWGLAGNAALVIGPRHLTRAASLDGRVFLHSYDEALDPEGAVLEQLMTAPLVVAQWINAQYFFSAAAPGVLGAGDKTTHNVVGDVGVLSGAHGDLRTGLPWQALFRSRPDVDGVEDTDALVHEPLRLGVVIVASPDRVRDVVLRHAGLRGLVANEWITLLAAPQGQRLQALGTDLHWHPLAARDRALDDSPTRHRSVPVHSEA